MSAKPSSPNIYAEKLKAQGNAAFQSANYEEAETLYTRAISHDPENPTLYTNRALTRLRLSLYPSVLLDAQKALDLEPAAPGKLKAHTYLGQAHLQLGNAEEAVRESRKAYELAVEQRSPSLASIAQHVLAAKKEAWEHRERERILLENETLRKTLSAIDGADYEDKEALKKTVEEVFAKADAERCRRREVPDYLVDQISFGVMVDPMVTKTGHSYERSTLLDHLKRSKTDPLTRETLFESDLRPNFGLRAAGEEFLKENGWAVDW